MKFVKTEDLKQGMRLARPIYNKMGVMLYERDTMLTAQGIISVRNFGLIGIYILEPAEPVPPITEEELEFERFQTMAVFQLKDDMTALRNRKAPTNYINLSKSILAIFGSLDHKINFLQNIRSSSDFVYKHSINTAILSAIILGATRIPEQNRQATIIAALFQDLGSLLLPHEIFEKKDDDLTDMDRAKIRKCLDDGLALLDPTYNRYLLPDLSLKILKQLVIDNDPKLPSATSVPWLPETQVIQVARAFDTLTAMRLGQEPISELKAIQYLIRYPSHYAKNFVTCLIQRIHVLPTASCVDLSDGSKGLVIQENPNNLMTPVIIKFSDHKLYDLGDPNIRKKLYVVDIMRTMDNRIKTDAETLKQFSSDPVTGKTMSEFLKTRQLLSKKGRL